MEVHTHGWPEHLPENALKKRLEPIMAKLDIPNYAFSCDKPRGYKWANLTFLDVAHGESFLKQHGEERGFVPFVRYGGARRPQRKARLQLFGGDIFCSISRERGGGPNPPAKKPDPITLRGLRHAADEKVKPTYRVEREGGPEVFDVKSLSCGHTTFLGENLVYLPEVRFQDVSTARFTKRSLLIKLQSKRIVKIPLETVVGFVYSSEDTLTLTLSEEPSFFEDASTLETLFRQIGLSSGSQSRPTRTRLCSLNDQHARVIGQCLVYQLKVSGDDLRRRILRLKKHDMLNFVRYDLTTQSPAPLQLGATSEAMDALMRELSACAQSDHLPFRILFQLQALAWNAYFHPGIVLALTRELRRVSELRRAAGRRLISAEALKKLKETPWPMPHGNPSLFDVEAIIQFLIETEDKMSRGEAFREALESTAQSLATIHRVTVTPTRVTLHGPELEANNRILRKFPNHHEYFVRVQFCDENGQDLFFNPGVSNEEVYERFKRIFRDGVEIAGRHYSFLGWSHSSLRSHSVWVGSIHGLYD